MIDSGLPLKNDSLLVQTLEVTNQLSLRPSFRKALQFMEYIIVKVQRSTECRWRGFDQWADERQDWSAVNVRRAWMDSCLRLLARRQSAGGGN